MRRFTINGFTRWGATSFVSALFIAAPLACLHANPDTQRKETEDVSGSVARALQTITADELRGDLSFLASDALQGRYTPSPGLDVAAEFIASRFRASGLLAAGDSEYFQTATLVGRKFLPPESAPGTTTSSKPPKVKNVIGVLSGSDSELKNTYVLLTAHYDHLGTTATAGQEAAARPPRSSPDQIYNGANDDGSGTVSIIAIAAALAKLNPHPKRTIVFIAFAGEELGLLGSKYYALHPAFPLSKTIADINLEQLGRTDSPQGREVNKVTLTGYDYSDFSSFLERAGRVTGIAVYVQKKESRDYFVRSDNASLAKRGVPAHTLCVAFDYPDYHRVGDEWQKIDYDNMARVDRMVAVCVLELANGAKTPEWNSANPKTAVWREEEKKLRAN